MGAVIVRVYGVIVVIEEVPAANIVTIAVFIILLDLFFGTLAN